MAYDKGLDVMTSIQKMEALGMSTSCVCVCVAEKSNFVTHNLFYINQAGLMKTGILSARNSNHKLETQVMLN